MGWKWTFSLLAAGLDYASGDMKPRPLFLRPWTLKRFALIELYGDKKEGLMLLSLASPGCLRRLCWKTGAFSCL